VKPDAATWINEPGSGSDARYKVGTFSGPGVMRRDAMRLPLWQCARRRAANRRNQWRTRSRTSVGARGRRVGAQTKRGDVASAAPSAPASRPAGAARAALV